MCTQIRTDIAHVQHAISRWACFNKVSWNVKELYLRCTGLMSIIDKLDTFTEFLENLFILAGSQFSTEISRNAKKFLMERIKTFNFDIKIKHEVIEQLSSDDEEENAFVDVFENEDSRKRKSSLELYVQGVIDNAKKKFILLNPIQLTRDSAYLTTFIYPLS